LYPYCVDKSTTIRGKGGNVTFVDVKNVAEKIKMFNNEEKWKTFKT